MKRTIVTLVAIASLVLPTAASATPNDPNGAYTPNGGVWYSNSFQSPTGNIKCHYWTAGPLEGILTCTTLNTGLTIYLDGAYGTSDNYSHLAEGQGPTLVYGSYWQGTGFKCVSRFNGMTCTSGGHGFFVNRTDFRVW